MLCVVVGIWGGECYNKRFQLSFMLYRSLLARAEHVATSEIYIFFNEKRSVLQKSKHPVKV